MPAKGWLDALGSSSAPELRMIPGPPPAINGKHVTTTATSRHATESVDPWSFPRPAGQGASFAYARRFRVVIVDPCSRLGHDATKLSCVSDHHGQHMTTTVASRHAKIGVERPSTPHAHTGNLARRQGPRSLPARGGFPSPTSGGAALRRVPGRTLRGAGGRRCRRNRSSRPARAITWAPPGDWLRRLIHGSRRPWGVHSTPDQPVEALVSTHQAQRLDPSKRAISCLGKRLCPVLPRSDRLQPKQAPDRKGCPMFDLCPFCPRPGGARSYAKTPIRRTGALPGRARGLDGGNWCEREPVSSYLFPFTNFRGRAAQAKMPGSTVPACIRSPPRCSIHRGHEKLGVAVSLWKGSNRVAASMCKRRPGAWQQVAGGEPGARGRPVRPGRPGRGTERYNGGGGKWGQGRKYLWICGQLCGEPSM